MRLLEGQGAMNYRLDHVGMLSRDLETALQTYEVGFGNEVVGRWYKPGNCDVAAVGAGCDVTFQLVGGPFHDDEVNHVVRHGYSIHHLGFLAPDVDAAYEELVSRDVPSVWRPISLMGMRQCRLEDPDGLVFEIRASLAPRDQPRAAEPADRLGPARMRAHHVSILTHDLRRSQRFYEEMLGLRTVYEYVEDDGGFVFLVDHDYDPAEHDFLLEIIGPPGLEPREAVLLERRGPCYDHLCYVAEDVRAAWQGAVDRGAIPTEEPVWAYNNWISWLRDADGNDVEVMGPIASEIILEALRTGMPFDSTEGA